LVRTMFRFLIVFDRKAGHTLEFRPVGTAVGAATRARLEAEDAYRGDKNVEVVVLSSSSEANIRRTHARYFENVSELASRGAAATRN
jgi:hypothetical protein